MNALLRLAPPPSYQNYACQGCGRCCRGRFHIMVSAEDRDRILAQGWEGDPTLPSGPLFTPAGGMLFQLAHREDGSCAFLNEQGLCRIHAKFGEPAKPLACRVYPFKLIPTGEKVRVDLRCDCPAIPANYGASLSDHREYLREILPLVVPEKAANQPPAPLMGTVQLSWSKIERITNTFVRLIRYQPLDFTTRMVACANVAALLHNPRIATLNEEKLVELLQAVFVKVTIALADAPASRLAPSFIENLAFRQLVGIYAREDRQGTRGMLAHRLQASLRMIFAQGKVPPLHPGFPAVAFADIEHPIGTLSAELTEPFERLYRLHLESQGFFGPGYYGYNYLHGLNALLLTYPITLWFARVYAVARGLQIPDHPAIEQAITVASHQHGILSAFNMPTERYRFRFLSERNTLRRLMLWYGS